VTESQDCVHVTLISMDLTVLNSISCAPITVQITEFVTDLQVLALAMMVTMVMIVLYNISFVPIIVLMMESVTV